MAEPPRATYRLQLRAGMTFARAAAVVPHLARLGISHLYLSPPFAAVPGSTHGYDVVDPNRLEPELGGEAGFMTLRRALDEHGIGLVLDIVPNHMGIGPPTPGGGTCCAMGKAAAGPVTSTSTSPPTRKASWSCRCWRRRWRR